MAKKPGEVRKRTHRRRQTGGGEGKKTTTLGESDSALPFLSDQENVKTKKPVAKEKKKKVWRNKRQPESLKGTRRGKEDLSLRLLSPSVFCCPRGAGARKGR